MSTTPDARRWKVLAGSATGTSHSRNGDPCQDSHHFTISGRGDSAALVLVCADGAGSASRSSAGSRLACNEVISAASQEIEAGLRPSEITPCVAARWYDRARRRLSLEACVAGLDLREYACTLLTAVVGARGAVFVQLGDGAIVYRAGDGYQTAVWPQSGEYANTTNFLTASDFRDQLAVRNIDSELEELALFTDGLQPLALHYATRTVHAPFFDPMFAAIRAEPDPDRLQVPLNQFLASRPVTDRTDDDTTLILATRRAASHDSAQAG